MVPPRSGPLQIGLENNELFRHGPDNRDGEPADLDDAVRRIEQGRVKVGDTLQDGDKTGTTELSRAGATC
jgi:hypothetical protein